MTQRTSTRTPGKQGQSDAQRAQRRKQNRGRLEQATRALLTSEGGHEWVRVRSRKCVARYSFANQLLIATQCPDATFVAGFRAFLDLNRVVRKGEKAIRILAPITLKNKPVGAVEDVEDVEVDEQGHRVVFRTVFVFDVSQTDPMPGKTPVPLDPPSQPVTGESHAHQLRKLGDLALELGYSVSYRELHGAAEGWCDAHNKAIVVNGVLPENGRVRVLAHELAHAHAHGIGYADYGRVQAEVMVDTITYIVCASVGLDVSGSSVPYVAGWGEDGELDPSRASHRERRRPPRSALPTSDPTWAQTRYHQRIPLPPPR